MKIKTGEKFAKLLKKSRGGKFDALEETSEIFGGFLMVDFGVTH